jgi:lipid-binding SYLF domain-containing protein
MRKTVTGLRRGFAAAIACAALTAAGGAPAASTADAKLAAAAAVLQEFQADDAKAIPARLLQRAYGIAVLPDVFRGGFILAARRGRGVLVVRSPDGQWSNPAFITLTGGSIGWQIGAESADVVLIFANKAAVKHIASGKFTLGGDASAVAGPVGRHATAAVTFKAQVYSYVRSQGLFAGASFEGARLAINHEADRAYYAADSGGAGLSPQSARTPQSARNFLAALRQASIGNAHAGSPTEPQGAPQDRDEHGQEAVTYPLGK